MHQPQDTKEDSRLTSWTPKLCQVEIPVFQVEDSLNFYENVFGWQAAPIEIHNYIVLMVPDQVPFGVSLIPQTSRQSRNQQITLYFGVDGEAQLTEVLEQVEQAGGQIQGKLRPVPGYGYVQFISDPNGHRFGLFLTQAVSTPPGSEKSKDL